MKPYLHALNSARRHGGQPADYLPIHDFLDSSKAATADGRHRAALHHAFGCFVVERVFGVTAVNSDGRTYSPRDVAEEHILEDLGFIPSLEQWVRNIAPSGWMYGNGRRQEIRCRGLRLRVAVPVAPPADPTA